MAIINTIMNNLHPGFIMIVAGVLVMVLPKKISKVVYFLGPVGALAALFKLNADSSLIYTMTQRIKIQFIHFDNLTLIFLVAFCLISVIGVIFSLNGDNKLEHGISLIYAGCNMGVVLAGDVISLIVFWEISALASTYIVYCKRCRKSSRAAFRYLLVHGFGGNVLLVGILSYMFHYGTEIMNVTGTNNITFWLILIGVGVNAAVPPINSWLPDAYPESTIGGTVFLGSFTTKAAIYVMIRFFAGTQWLVWVGAFMAIYGVCMALLENDLRRLFCYHIISQLGYMIASLAIGGAWGIDGSAAHTFNNILYKGTLLMCAGSVVFATGKRKITELGGLYKKMPITAICFLIASFAISGVPFLNGFASKALIMHAVEHGGYELAALALTVASVGTWLSVALKVNYFVFFGPIDKDVEKVDVEIVNPLPWNMKLGMILGSLACIVSGVRPRLVYMLTLYQTDGNPFTMEHIVEYICLFVGATIMFWVLRKKMTPHDEITLDFDYFYRRGVTNIVYGLGKGIHAIFSWFDGLTLKVVQSTGQHFGNPYLWTKNSNNEGVKKFSFENEDRLIGDVILVIVGTMIAVLVVAVFTVLK